MLELKQNTSYPLVVAVIDNMGNYDTSISVTYEVRKSSDNSLIDSGSLTNIGDIYVAFITINQVGDFYALYTTPQGYENGKEILRVDSATFSDIDSVLDTLTTNISKVLGLSQSNYVLKNPTYNSEGCLLSGLIFIYSNSTDAENETGHIASFTITSEYDTEGRLSKYKVVEN